MNTTLIHIDNLSFGYRRKAPLFSQFNLDIPTGEIIGLLGKNGTGKSTLLYLICGLLRPKQGTITMQGTDVKKRLPLTLSETYLVPEEFNLPNVSMKQFVKLNAGFYPRFSQEILSACLHPWDRRKRHISALHWPPIRPCY